MLASEPGNTKRLNVMVSESLVEWATEVAELRGMSLSALVRLALEKERERTRENEIEQAAENLATLYSSDHELTAFTAIDAEDFL